jgi:hypothetical protein
MKTDNRRATRTAVHTAGAIVMLIYLGWLIHKMQGGQLTLVALGLVAILLLREMLHGVENVAARIKFSVGKDGASGEIER